MHTTYWSVRVRSKLLMVAKRLTLLVTLFIVAAVIGACSSSSRSDIKAAHSDLSGIYRFNGLNGFSPDEFPNPLVDLNEIGNPSDITIVQTDTNMQATYLSESGESITRSVDLPNDEASGAVWQNSVLTTTNSVPVAGAPILPLPAKHFRGTRILRAEDGHLYFIGTFKEKGFLFTEYWENELMFERMD